MPIKILNISFKKLGDILKIETGERSPADIIIIDSYEKNFLVDSDFLDGKSSPSTKRPLKLTCSNLSLRFAIKVSSIYSSEQSIIRKQGEI